MVGLISRRILICSGKTLKYYIPLWREDNWRLPCCQFPVCQNVNNFTVWHPSIYQKFLLCTTTFLGSIKEKYHYKHVPSFFLHFYSFSFLILFLCIHKISLASNECAIISKHWIVTIESFEIQGMIRIYLRICLLLSYKKMHRVSFVFEKPSLDVLLMMMDLSRNLY